jgi:hypothetical protein
MTRHTKILLLTILTVCEIACFMLCRWSVSTATIVYTLAGIAIATISLIGSTQSPGSPLLPRRYGGYTYILYMAILLLIANWIKNVFHAHIYATPFDLHMGDMLIFMREMSMRYIQHQHVYDMVTSVYGVPVHAVYLPAFWLPYTVPLYFGADMRWMSLVAFIAAVWTAAFILPRRFDRMYFLLWVPIALLTYLVLSGAAYYLMFTQEALVMFYVALLAWSLIYDYWIVAGIAAAMCIMSRYFIGVPILVGLVWLYTRGSRAGIRMSLSLFASLIVIISVSRSWGDIGYFFQIPFLYIGLLNDGSSFEAFRHIYQGSVGFASFFHAEGVYIISRVNLAILILAPLVYFIFAYRYLSDRRKGLVILSGTKFFLVLFLTTLSRPFGYVLYTASMVSIMLLRDALIHTGPDVK